MTKPAREVFTLMTGRHPTPRLAGRYAGRSLLVAGSARGVWEDLALFGRVDDGAWDVMALNVMGAFYPGRLEHWASLHPEHVGGLARLRRDVVDGRETHFHTSRPFMPAPERPAEGARPWHAWAFANLGGTTGAFAALVGLGLGYDRVVLAGVPMDNSGHFYDAPWVRGTGTFAFGDPNYQTVWCELRDRVFEGRVTSLSGRTRDWLGAPS